MLPILEIDFRTLFISLAVTRNNDSMEGEREDKDDVLKAQEIEDLDIDETLKYHLLGPSLTKAGQDSVDQRKVGSRYR